VKQPLVVHKKSTTKMLSQIIIGAKNKYETHAFCNARYATNLVDEWTDVTCARCIGMLKDAYTKKSYRRHWGE